MTLYVDEKPLSCDFCKLYHTLALSLGEDTVISKRCAIDPEDTSLLINCPLQLLPEPAEPQEFLKRCPYCGWIDPVRLDEDRETADFAQYQVICDYNKGGCGASGGVAKTGVEAIKKWNRRDESK